MGSFEEVIVVPDIYLDWMEAKIKLDQKLLEKA